MSAIPGTRARIVRSRYLHKKFKTDDSSKKSSGKDTKLPLDQKNQNDPEDVVADADMVGNDDDVAKVDKNALSCNVTSDSPDSVEWSWSPTNDEFDDNHGGDDKEGEDEEGDCCVGDAGSVFRAGRQKRGLGR